RGIVDNAVFPAQWPLRGDRQPEIWRVGTQRVAEEGRWSDTRESVRDLIDIDRGADNGRIAAEFLLPGAIAHHHGRCRAARIVRRRKDPAGEGANAESREIVAGNELAVERLGGRGGARTPYAQLRAAALERGHLA